MHLHRPRYSVQGVSYILNKKIKSVSRFWWSNDKLKHKNVDVPRGQIKRDEIQFSNSMEQCTKVKSLTFVDGSFGNMFNQLLGLQRNIPGAHNKLALEKNFHTVQAKKTTFQCTA